MSGVGKRPWLRVFGGSHEPACPHLQQLQHAVDPGSAWRAVRYGQPRHRLVGERAHARCAATTPCCCPSPCWYDF